MSDLVISHATLPAITPGTLAKVQHLEELLMEQPQAPLVTEHLIHGGMYARTVRVPAGALFVGALVKCPTVLTIHGSVQVLVSEGVTADLEGYNVIPASAGRKQVFFARSPLELTAIFALKAATVSLDPRQAIAEAEAEFTDEVDSLLSRRQDNDDTITITGE